jgi:hypothetical protein
MFWGGGGVKGPALKTDKPIIHKNIGASTSRNSVGPQRGCCRDSFIPLPFCVFTSTLKLKKLRGCLLKAMNRRISINEAKKLLLRRTWSYVKGFFLRHTF